MDKKQSAFARRLMKSLESLTENVDKATNTSLFTYVSNSETKISDLSGKIEAVNGATVSNFSDFLFEKDSTNPLSWESRILDLENNPSGGGGGIDPTDPDQPILMWDNFLNQSNGDESGSVSPYPYFGSPRPTSSQLLTPYILKIYEADSETNHIGVVEVRLEYSISSSGYISLVNSETLDSFTYSDFNSICFIVKLKTFTDDYQIKLGLFEDISNPNVGIYFDVTSDTSNRIIPTCDDGTVNTGSTTAFTLDSWYTLKIRKISATSVGFTINNGTEEVLSTNIPSGFLNCGVYFLNTAGTATQDISFNIDFFSLKLKDTGLVPPGSTIVGTANEVEVTTVGSTITIGLPNAITVQEATVNQINFTMPGTSPTLSMGELAWDVDHNTIVYQISSTVHVPLGTAVYQHVRNESNSVTIDKGDIVYVNGSQGVDRLKVSKALANAEATSAPTIGLAAESIAPNADGYIVTYGLLHGVTTTGYAAGDRIYLSESTAGGWRTTLPTAPNHGTFVGWVVKGGAGSGAGSVFVKIHNYNELSELSDILISSIANNDILQWDNTDLRWENRSLTTAGIAAASHTHTLNGLTPLNQGTLVGRWSGAGSGIAQEVTIGNGLKLSTGGILLVDSILVPASSTTFSAGLGLTGGGDLSANRTFTVDFATSGTSNATQAVRADDSRLSDSRTPTAHTHTLSDITQSGATSNQVPQWNGTNWVPATVSAGFTPQRTVFTSSGTFTIPSGATTVRIICVGGGGGGGGGCLSNSTSSNRCGGAGGGGGSVNIGTYLVSVLSSTLTITIGTGGSQGGGAVSNGSSGSAGGTAGVTSVTSSSYNGTAGTTRICWGNNGLGGSGGTVGGTSSTGGSGGSQGYNGGTGGAGSNSTGSIGSQTSGSTGLSYGPYGGGGGGGINSSNVHAAGGNCFGIYPFQDSNTTAGAAGGGAGPAATATRGTSHDWGNVGGSGGGGNNAGAGGAGGAGIYGSGGGGGGAGSSSSGGTGGLGGSGLVIIYSY